MSTGFRSILVALDLTPLSDRVVGRVALLPLAEEARLTLLHLVPSGLPLHAQRRVERDAHKALRDEVKHLAKVLPEHVVIEPVVEAGAAATRIVECASAMKAELIVMGRGGGRALREVFLGSTAERVIRRGQLPVLVVRLPPRRSDNRPVLALDLDQAAHAVFAMLLRLVPSPRLRVKIVHAIDNPYRTIVYPSLSAADAEDYREFVEKQATKKFEAVVSVAIERAKVLPHDMPSWEIHVRHGSPRLAIERMARKVDADILALGTHGYTGIAHTLLGKVAGDVLRTVTSDVLVVPPSADDARRP